MLPNLPFFGRIKRHPKAWWCAEVKDAVDERHKVFAVANRCDENRQAYISASRCALPVIAKAKAEVGQTICSFLSSKSNSKSVYSLIRSVAGFSFSSPSSPNFPNCSFSKKSASVFANYLRSHFSFSQPKVLRSGDRGCLSELRRATCPKESHLSFCSLFSPGEFLAAASNLFSSTATGPDKVSIQSQSTFLALAWTVFFTFSIFPDPCIPFLPSGRHLILFPYTRWETSRLSCFLPAYLSHLLRLKVF